MGEFLFLREGKPLKEKDFPTSRDKKILQISCFYDQFGKFLSHADFNTKYNIATPYMDYLSLRSSISAGARKMSINFANILNNERPIISLLTSTLLTPKKGSSHIYKLFRANPNLKRNTRSPEQKFHTKLNTILSVDFWNKNWIIFSQLIVSNKIKWMELQLKHYTLPNNYTVNKYNPLTSPCCTFCKQSMEEIPHLFFFCNKVKILWLYLENTLFDIGLPLTITKFLALLGDIKSHGGSWINTILALTRYFIWVEKFKGGNLSVNDFRLFMEMRLKNMREMFIRKSVHNNIDPACWTLIAEFV